MDDPTEKTGKESKNYILRSFFPYILVFSIFLPLFFFLISQKISAVVVASSISPKSFAVVAVNDQTGSEQWGDLLIAYGIANLISEEFYNTGLYVPVEDKPEIILRIKNFIKQSWQGKESFTPHNVESEAEAIADELGCDVVVCVNIKNFRKRRTRGFAGPFSAAKVDVSVDVELIAREKGKYTRSAMGRGSEITKSLGMLFQIREDKVHFDQTSVGRAVHDAVREAVMKLMRL